MCVRQTRSYKNNNKQDANMKHINTLQERHQYNVVHLRWDTSTHKFPVLYYYIVHKNEGRQPTTHRLHFLFTFSQFLSHNHIDHFYNATIQYTTLLEFLSFIEGLPWENTMG